MLAVSHLAIACLQYGKLRLAAEAATEAIARSKRSSPTPPWMVGAVYSALGMVYYEWGQTAKAHDCLERGLRLGTFSGHIGTVIYTRVSLAKLLQAEGDLAGTGRARAEAGALFEEGAPNWLRSEMIARQGSFLVAQSRPDEAEAVLRQSGIATEAPVTHETDGVHLAWLRLLSVRRSPRATDLAYRMIESAEAGERHGTLLQALILAALLPGEEIRIRHDWLARAVTLAEPEGYVRIFVDSVSAPPAPAAALTPGSVSSAPPMVRWAIERS
jgi:LuxR family maltose regulon positive regulatory protein